LFVMVTMKSIKEAYVLMCYYWSWLAIPLIIIYVVIFFFPTYELFIRDINLYEYMPVVARWLHQVLFFATCLATRPSMMRKSCAYFRSQMIIFLYWALFLCFMPFSFWQSAISAWS